MAESDWKYLQYNIETGQKRTGDGPSGGASSLSDLDDTSISNPSDGQMLGYDETEGKWKNVNAPAGSVSDVQLDNESVVDQNGVAKLTTPNIDALGKTAISNPADGEMLGYDETEGKWKNVAAPGGNVDDVKVNGNSVVSNKVANITSYKEVTQAQYEALPDTKLSDNVMYLIKDISSGADSFPPLIYSDEEREVGVWRDGKPLYQRTFHVTATGNSDTDLATNIDHFFLVGNTYYGDTDKLSEQYIGSGVTAYCYLQTVQVNGVWTLRLHNMHNNVLTFWVTVRYTKTTDTPGSGTWTTQGALAHHYSTDEHIVGTWIDGKPLYEKVFDLNGQSIASNSFVSIGVPLTNYSIDQLIYGRVTDIYGQSFACGCANVSGNIGVYLNISGTRYCSKLILQYTKTTD